MFCDRGFTGAMSYSSIYCTEGKSVGKKDQILHSARYIMIEILSVNREG